jgi:hypothetical protein
MYPFFCLFLISQRYDVFPSDSADDTCLRVLLPRSVEIEGHEKEIHHLPLQILAPLVDDLPIVTDRQPPLRRLRQDPVRSTDHTCQQKLRYLAIQYRYTWSGVGGSVPGARPSFDGG